MHDGDHATLHDARAYVKARDPDLMTKLPGALPEGVVAG